jgi:hypothetical protein
MNSNDVDIKHFLVIYDISAGEASVDGRFSTDYDAALEAYAAAEATYRGRDDVEVVLLSADSIDTIKKTHSSYFDTRERRAETFFSSAVEEIIASWTSHATR